MDIPPEVRARGKRVLIRGGLLILVLAAELFLPGPSGPGPVALFDTLLFTIFAMLTIGLTGPALRFIVLSAFGILVVLPIAILTLISVHPSTGLLDALIGVWRTLTEDDPLAGLYLVAPAIVVSILAELLGRGGFTLPGIKPPSPSEMPSKR